jgi:hypothetical protein
MGVDGSLCCGVVCGDVHILSVMVGLYGGSMELGGHGKGGGCNVL